MSNKEILKKLEDIKFKRIYFFLMLGVLQRTLRIEFRMQVMEMKYLTDEEKLSAYMELVDEMNYSFDKAIKKFEAGEKS